MKKIFFVIALLFCLSWNAQAAGKGNALILLRTMAIGGSPYNFDIPKGFYYVNALNTFSSINNSIWVQEYDNAGFLITSILYAKVLSAYGDGAFEAGFYCPSVCNVTATLTTLGDNLALYSSSFERKLFSIHGAFTCPPTATTDFLIFDSDYEIIISRLKAQAAGLTVTTLSYSYPLSTAVNGYYYTPSSFQSIPQSSGINQGQTIVSCYNSTVGAQIVTFGFGNK